MRLNYRSPFFAFVLGIAFGGALGAASVVHTVTIQAEKRLASLTEMWDRQLKDADHLTDQCREKLEKEQATTAEYLRAGQAMQQQLDAQDFRGSWYTMLYEPVPPAQTVLHPNDLLALANLARPGLGTLLSKVAPVLEPKPSDQVELRWILHGYVKPVAIPPNFHAVYTLTPQAVQ